MAGSTCRTFAMALIAADPAGKEAYAANAKKYLAEIDAVEKLVKDSIAKLPPAHRKIITTHDAFGYFGATYGMEFIAPEGVSTDSEASARDVAKIIRQIKVEKVPAVFLENVTDHRLLDQIARETGAKLGGTLYLGRPVGRQRAGRHLSGHVPPQHPDAGGGAFVVRILDNLVVVPAKAA